MVQCTLSPDGKYLVSGSETGKPFIWDEFEAQVDTDDLHCEFGDLVADCDWNPRYNMFAVSGFGQAFPVLIYAYVRSLEEQQDLNVAAQRQGFRLQAAVGLEDDPQNEEIYNKIAEANVSIFFLTNISSIILFFSGFTRRLLLITTKRRWKSQIRRKELRWKI